MKEAITVKEGQGHGMIFSLFGVCLLVESGKPEHIKRRRGRKQQMD